MKTLKMVTLKQFLEIIMLYWCRSPKSWADDQKRLYREGTLEKWVDEVTGSAENQHGVPCRMNLPNVNVY